MSPQEKIIFKKTLQQKAAAIIQQRIDNCMAAMQHAQLAANEEEKSSAGDKYETSRAMSHIEKDMYARQLEENKKDMALLLSVNCEVVYDKAVAGAIIDCDEILFFVAAGIGKMEFEGKLVFFLSPKAPLAISLYKTKPGDKFVFNNTALTIRSTY